MAKILSLDLELNKDTDENVGGKTTDIIEIGACILDTEKGEIVSTFKQVVKPEGFTRLSKFIVILTGITDEEINRDGVSLSEAYNKLVEYRNNHFDITPNRQTIFQMQWGCGDFEELQAQTEKVGCKWVFHRRTIDVKTVHQTVCMAKGWKTQSGLAKSMTRYGLAFKGKIHRATDDSVNTAKLYLHIIKNMVK